MAPATVAAVAMASKLSCNRGNRAFSSVYAEESSQFSHTIPVALYENPR